jgi:SagB-type dehydrogenase family enzyme
LRVSGTRKKKERRAAPATISARIAGHVSLEARPDGKILACFNQHSVDLGQFSATTAERAQGLREGLPLDTFEGADKEICVLVRRLASHGLLEYCTTHTENGSDEVVVEPLVPDYWPRRQRLLNTDVLVLSRFAYMRRRGEEMILESPLAAALFKICNPEIATAIAVLAKPQELKQLRQRVGFPGLEILALLVDCQILFKIESTRDSSLRPAEGNDSLVLWDFHDLLFHTRSTEGRHANPLGGLYPYAGAMAPLPAVRPRWPGKKLDLRKLSTAYSESAAARLLRERYSVRVFDDEQPITLAELAQFLAHTARVQSKWRSSLDGGPTVAYAGRPYPSGGGSYELELYLAVNNCDGLAKAFYHYDAGGHALVQIDVRGHELEAMLAGAEVAMGAPAAPQILITIAARFGRISWKYSSLAYALILKDVGVLLQTFYLMAIDMGLGGCAIGSSNINLFAKMTGIEFYVEGPVGLFAMGRGAKLQPPD